MAQRSQPAAGRRIIGETSPRRGPRPTVDVAAARCVNRLVKEVGEGFMEGSIRGRGPGGQFGEGVNRGLLGARGGGGRLTSVEVEDFAQRFGDRSVVGAAGHQWTHGAPPPLADLGLRDLIPALGAFDFRVGEELAG